jgi:MerR family transcriptional regulator, light-induced transcriptional regulator
MSGRKDGGAALFPIGAVARKTGLSTHVLRAWERRYGVVEPKRAEGGTRLYDEADVVRLRLLKRVVDAGHPIGQVAAAPTEGLLALLREEAALAPVRGADAESVSGEVMEQCLAALEGMDGARVHAVLMRAVVVMGAERFLEILVVPLLHRVGELWREGTLCPAHEHLFSATVKRVLAWMMEQVTVPGAAQVLVATTPSGHRHEMGAMLTGVVAAEEGWRVEYLGPDLPAADIARAVAAAGASAVALSMIHEEAEEGLVAEVRDLRGRIPGSVALLVGGRAADEHGEQLTRAGALWLRDLGALRRQLRTLAPNRTENKG